MLQFTEGRQQQENEMKDSRKGERQKKKLRVLRVCVCILVNVGTAWI